MCVCVCVSVKVKVTVVPSHCVKAHQEVEV